MNFGFQPAPASHFGTRPLPLLNLSASSFSASFSSRSSLHTQLPAQLLGASSSSLFPAVDCQLSTARPKHRRRPHSCSLSAFNFKLSTLNSFLANLSPATHTRPLQLAENAATLSLASATFTNRVKHNFFVCHSYRKHPWWGMTSFLGVQAFQPATPR